MTIRKATLDDLKIIHHIETLSFNEGSYPLFVLRQFYDISKDYFLVAQKEDEILGYILGSLAIKDDRGWLLSLGVLPEARGQQIGKELTRTLIALLETQNTKEICLTVHPNNTSAVKLYRNLGFEIIRTDNNYYLDHDPRLLMKKRALTNLINS